MKEIPIDFGPVRLIEPSFRFFDHRGEITEDYNEEALRQIVGYDRFPKSNITVSKRWTLRGIHTDVVDKIFQCVTGEIFMVAVNALLDPRWKRWRGFYLSDANRLQLYIPPDFGAAHLVVSEQATVLYRWGGYYDRARQGTLRWNDHHLGIEWPLPKGIRPILSERDENG